MSLSLLLHFGEGKAGSSALQQMLAQNRGQLAQHGILYPVLGGYPEHEELLAAYQGPAKAAPRLRNRLPASADPRAHAMDRLAAELGAHSGLILSAEHLFWLDAGELAAFEADLRALGVDRIRAVYYAREPAAGFMSAVSENIKPANLFPDVNTYRPAFAESLPRWQAVLGDSVTVRPCTRAGLIQGDICADFLALASETLGLPPAQARGTTVNTRLSAEAMIVLNRFHRRAPVPREGRWTAESRQFFNQLGATPTPWEPTKAQPSEAVQALVYRNAAADLAYLWETFGVAFTPPVPPAEPDAGIAAADDVTHLLADYDSALADELGWVVTVRTLQALHKARRGG